MTVLVVLQIKFSHSTKLIVKRAKTIFQFITKQSSAVFVFCSSNKFIRNFIIARDTSFFVF